MGYLGRANGGPLAPLRSLCRSVEVLGAPGAESSGRPEVEGCDLVVACEPSESELGWAAQRVRPGGALVVETRGPIAAWTRARRRWRHARPPDRIARRISRLGFEDVRSYWHWPSLDRCTRIVPLDDPTALRYALSRAGRGAKGRLGSWLGRGLHRMGVVGWVVGSATVIGRRPREARPGLSVAGRADRNLPCGGGEAPPGLSVVHGFLNDRWDRLDLGPGSRRLSFVALTPRFRNSSHLVFLLLPEGESEAVLVAKLPRQPGRCSKLDREAELLREIQAIRPAGFETIPRPIVLEAYGDRTILLETAMRGRAMDRATVRREAARCCQETLAWLIEVQTAPGPVSDRGTDALERLIERELLEAETRLPAERALLERTRELVEPLSSAGLAPVLEHGDLGHPNLLVGPEGRVSVIDWELAELRGLPACDLFFFLAYVGRALRGARSSGEVLSALDRAFFGRRSWARTYVDHYARRLGIPRDALTPLFVACWIRQVTGLARRVANGGEAATPGGATAAWLREDWRFAVWRHAVEQSSRLDWEDLP